MSRMGGRRNAVGLNGGRYRVSAGALLMTVALALAGCRRRHQPRCHRGHRRPRPPATAQPRISSPCRRAGSYRPGAVRPAGARGAEHGDPAGERQGQPHHRPAGRARAAPSRRQPAGHRTGPADQRELHRHHPADPGVGGVQVGHQPGCCLRSGSRREFLEPKPCQRLGYRRGAVCPPGHGLGVDGSPGRVPAKLRNPADQSTSSGRRPGRRSPRSTAMNADVAYAIWRSCFNGRGLAAEQRHPRSHPYRARRSVGLRRPLVAGQLVHLRRRGLHPARPAPAAGERSGSSPASSSTAEAPTAEAPTAEAPTAEAGAGPITFNPHIGEEGYVRLGL